MSECYEAYGFLEAVVLMLSDTVREEGALGENCGMNEEAEEGKEEKRVCVFQFLDCLSVYEA